MKKVIIARFWLILLAFVVVAIPTSAGSSPIIQKPYVQPTLFAQTIETSSQMRYPTGDYGVTGTWAVFPITLSTRWDKVDDENDGDTTYLTHGTTAGYALFNFTTFAVPTGSIVTKLEITYTARDVTGGVNNLRAALRVGGTNYLTTDTGIDLGTGYLAVTYAYVVNPKTSAVWTVADINGIGTNPLQQFGVNSSDANPAFRITSVTARVSYTQVVDTLTAPVYPAMDDGVITLAELTAEASSDAREGSYTFAQWDNEITQAGINHIDDKLLGDFVNDKAGELTETYTQLYDLYAKAPIKEQVAQINTNLIKLEAQKATLTSALTSVKGTGDKDTIQQAANKVAAVDGKISEFTQPLQYAGQIQSIESGIAVVKNKFKLALKEQSFRSDGLVTRTYVHSTYYMDFTANSGTIVAGATGITFTNASASATSATATFTTAGNTKVVANDYVRVSNGTQWYKVTGVAATTLTISPAFQQGTVTDTANASLISCPATHDSRTACDGTTIAKSFAHLNEYTTDTTRTAGDILKVRANQTNHLDRINITVDESGTVAAYDEIRGCSVADDPFSDTSNVQPIFDFGNTAYQIQLNGKNYWRLFNLDITNTAKTNSGLIYINSIGATVDTCTIHLGTASSSEGIRVSQSASTSPVYILNSTFYSIKNISIYAAIAAPLFITGCTINAGAGGSNYGIGCVVGAKASIRDTTIGVTTTHNTSSLYAGTAPVVWTLQNCSLADTVQVTGIADPMSSLTSEDDGQSIGAQNAYYSSGTVTKSSAVLRAGGGTSSAFLLPSSIVTIKYPLNVAYGSLNPDFAIWCPASATTVTVFMRANTIWSTYPTAAQLFIQADYWASGASIRSQSTASTQTLIDNREPAGAGTYTADAGTNTTTVVDAALAGTAYIGKYLYNTTRSAGAEITNYVDGTKTITLGTAIASQTTADTYYILDWVAFTTTMTPGTAGFVYIKINLGLYASGKGVFVDVKPVTS